VGAFTLFNFSAKIRSCATMRFQNHKQ